MAIQNNRYYEIQNVRYGSYMNMYGNFSGSTIPDATKLSLWTSAGGTDQSFAPVPYNGSYKLANKRNPDTHLVNRHSGNAMAIMWNVAGSSAADSVIYFEPVAGQTNVYRIRLNLKSPFQYLTATGATGYLYWQTSLATTDTSQHFRMLPTNSYVSSSGYGQVGTPSFTGHLVSHAGTGRALNVYGTESIENNRNVCLYDWGDNNAQTWKLASYNGDLKLFSNISYPTFALNVYRGDNNCNVLAHADNDADSHLYRTAVSGKSGVFTVRLKYGERAGYALTADGNYDLCNVSWQLYTGAENQQWLFTATKPATPSVGTSVFTGHLVSDAGAGRALNVYGNETISDSRNVCLYSWGDNNAQTWKLASYNGELKLFSALDYPTYALNVYRVDNNCTVLTHIGNDEDSHIYRTAVTGKPDVYTVRLKSGERAGYALTADGNYDLCNVSWQPYSSSNTKQQWLFAVTKPTAPPVGTPEFTGHLVSHAGTGGALNVYGNESIEDNINVCLYTWGDNNAQTWKLASYDGDLKLFSALDYPTYALNVYRGDNNCNVLQHVGNEEDSHIYRSHVMDKPDVYTVRLKYGERAGYALTAEENYNLSNVTWQPYIAGNTKQQWLFTNTRTGSVTEPPAPGMGDSSLNHVYMQAHINNYTPNRVSQGGSIRKITIHHCAGVMSVQSLGNLWQKPTRGGSSHYGVSGAYVGQYVMEKDVAWTDGNWSSNIRSVTIETSNSGGAPDWPIADTTFETLARLVADIAKRNELGRLVPGENLTWHNMYAATACPGPYLLARMDLLAARANEIMGEVAPLSISDAAYQAGVRLGVKDWVTYYDYTIPLDNLFAAAKAQAEENRCKTFEQYCEDYPGWDPPIAAWGGRVVNSFIWFYSQVKSYAIWDIKRDYRWEAALPNVPFLKDSEDVPKQFLYRDELVNPADMGNIMYGYVGRACGFSAVTLYWGGGVAHQGSMNNSAVNTPELYGDLPEDHVKIEYGYNLFESRYPDYPDVGHEGIPIEESLLAELADLIL